MEYSNLLRDILAQASHLLEKADIKDFDFKPVPDKWSKKQILGHLIDSAYNNHRRFVMASHQGHLNFDGYEQDAWVVRNRYQERDTNEIMDLWYSVNQHLAALIEGLPDALIRRKSTDHNFHLIGMNVVEKGTERSLSYLIWDYIYHLEHHLEQILPDYDPILTPFSES